MVIVGLLMVAFMGMAAFAVDFGWIYWNGIRIQHGADAAALSGVVYEPGDGATAYAEAFDAASENGYRHSDPGTTVEPIDFAEDPSAVFNANQLRVTITHEVPTFFMRVFGFESVSITKTSIAQYVLPLAMGSDDPYFGTDPELGRSPNFWGNIHGYYTGRKMGDRYASQCKDGGAKQSCTANPEARASVAPGTAAAEGGYVYGIEVPVGADGLSVDIFDGPFYRDGHDRFLVGDNPQGGNETERDRGPTTTFMLYSPDPTPLVTTDGNTLLCSVTFGSEDNFADFDGDDNVGSWNATVGKWTADPDDDRNGDGWFDWTDVALEPSVTWDDLWDEMCGGTSYYEGPGIYPLRVMIEDPGGSDDRGLNRYSLRAWTATGPDPRIYGLGDMAIYVNAASNFATFKLAEVDEVHAGKELVIELWDSDSGIGNVAVKMPDGSGPSCTWSASTGESGSESNCSIPTGSYDFDNAQMQIRIDIDNGYTCGTSCWWTIDLVYPDAANDTTTWSARIEGNPVKLIE